MHGDKLDEVNFAADKFLEVDSSCFDLIHDNINEQEVIGNIDNSNRVVNNINSIYDNIDVQINSKGNVVSASGDGAMAAGGNIIFNNNQNGLPVNELTELLDKVSDRLAEEKAQKQLLEIELARKKNNTPDPFEELKVTLEEMIRNNINTYANVSNKDNTSNTSSKEMLIQIFKNIEPFLPTNFFEGELANGA